MFIYGTYIVFQKNSKSNNLFLCLARLVRLVFFDISLASDHILELHIQLIQILKMIIVSFCHFGQLFTFH